MTYYTVSLFRKDINDDLGEEMKAAHQSERGYKSWLVLQLQDLNRAYSRV